MGVADLRQFLEGDTKAPASGVAALRAENEAPEPLTTAQRIVRGSAGSIIGGAIGGAAGTMVAPGPGTLAGAMIGSGIGEAVTQYADPFGSGVETPSWLQIGAASLLPGVPAAARRFFVSLPGAAAGLQEFMFKRLGASGERLISKIASPFGTADELFGQARREGAKVMVPLERTSAVTRTITREVRESKFATGGSTTLVKRAQDFVKAGEVPFEQFRTNQSDLGAVVRSLEAKGGAALGRAKMLYAAMWDDLEAGLSRPVPVAAVRGPVAALPPIGGTSPTAFGPTGRFVAREMTQREGIEQTLEAASSTMRGEPLRTTAGQVVAPAVGGPSVAGQTMRTAPAAAPIPTAVSPVQDTLRAALDAFKREEAARFLKDWFIGSTVRRVGQKNFDVDSLLTKIDRNRDVLGRLLPEEEVDDLIATLATKGLEKIPTMAKTPRLGFEQMPYGARAVVGGAAGVIGGVVGGGSTAAMVGGGAAGVLLIEGISVALTTKPGRALVRSMMESGATWDQIGSVFLQSGRTSLKPADEFRLTVPAAERSAIPEWSMGVSP